jgi:hypothetical protein
MPIAREVRLSLWLIILIFLQAGQPVQACDENAEPDLDPHHHSVDVTDSSQSLEISDFAIATIEIDSALQRESMIENASGTWQAFIIPNEQGHQRLYVEDLTNHIIYEIQGIPLPWRNFTDLVWVSDDILVFDQWSQPHHGVHYAVNIREQVLLIAAPFSDF